MTEVFMKLSSIYVRGYCSAISKNRAWVSARLLVAGLMIGPVLGLVGEETEIFSTLQNLVL